MTATTESATIDPAAAGPADVVREFLLALEAGDLDRSLGLLDENAVWINLTLPTVRGRARIERLLRFLFGSVGAGFRVHFHNVAADGNVVLTERTDALILGRFEQRLWVWGRFEIVDGKIAVWRDSFDWLDSTIGLIRGLLGVIAPTLNRRWPGEG
jgi:limonene-1,2-epoxide hydrolase